MFLGQSTESGWVPTGGWNEVSTDNRTETGQSADLSRVSTDNRTETRLSARVSEPACFGTVSGPIKGKYR